MILRQTHTYAAMEISPAAYAEIRAKFIASGYDHVFIKDGETETMDMHGIGLRAEATE